MRAFEYASPTSTKQALSLLGAASGGALVLAGGTDLLALMKDDIVHPKRLVNIKEIRELDGVASSSLWLRIGALTTLADLADNVNIVKDYSALADALNEAASPQIRRWKPLSASALLVLPQWFRPAAERPIGQGPGGDRGKPLPRDSRKRRPGKICQPIQHRSRADRLRGKDPLDRAQRKARIAAR